MRRIFILIFIALFSYTSAKNILVIGNEKSYKYLPDLLNNNSIKITFANKIVNGEWDLTLISDSSTLKNKRYKVVPNNIAKINAEGTFISLNDNFISYLNSCLAYELITSQSILGNSYRPDDIKRQDILYILQMCASEAIKHPKEVSEIDENWYLNFIPSQWEGKRVVFFGDSITDQNQITERNDIYSHMLEKLLGIIALNYSINGQQMNQVLGQEKSMSSKIGENFDAIIILMGTNDFNANIPIGEWYTETPEMTNHNGKEVLRKHRTRIFTDSTFRGRINTVISTLKSRYPTKQIIMLTPLHRSDAKFGERNIQPDESFANGSGNYIDEYVESIKEASSIWSIPVIDLFSLSGLYPGIKSMGDLYFRNPKDPAHIDLLHPNDVGHVRIAYTLAYQLISLPVLN